MERFRLSNGVKFTSGIVCGILLYAMIDIWSAGIVAGIILYAIIGFVMIWVLFNMPLYLKADSKQIIIRHPIGKTKILRSEVKEIIPIDRQAISSSIRLFGSGGFLGWYGIFYNREIGRYSMFSGDRENLHLIRTANKQYIISSKNSI